MNAVLLKLGNLEKRFFDFRAVILNFGLSHPGETAARCEYREKRQRDANIGRNDFEGGRNAGFEGLNKEGTAQDFPINGAKVSHHSILVALYVRIQ